MSTSLINHLFANNAPPLLIEAQYIQKEIDSLTEAIDGLQSQLNRLQTRRQNYRTLLSPLRRIPPEIFGEIFTFIPRNMLTKICLVCKPWRDAALVTPSLWSELELPLDITTSGYQKAISWLDRAGSLPKTVIIRGSTAWDCCGPKGCSIAKPLLAKLLTEGPEIDRLDLSCLAPKCFRNLLRILNRMKARWSKPRPWDALQSFKLKFTDCKWNELDPNDTIYHHMPPVTSLDLTLPSGLEVDTIDDDWIKLYIPSQFLVNLSTLELTCDWHPASILTTLQSCTSLQNLTVALRGNPDLSFKRETLDGPLPEDGLLLPRLRTLRLRYAAVSNISEILDIVNTPSLEELDVNFEMLDDGIKSTISGFDEDILDLIERSKCNLRRLKIHMAVFSDSEELKTILKNLPSLTHLLLNNTIFDLEIFRDLRCNEILPHLKVFEIFDCPTSDNRKLDMLCQFSEVYVRWSFGKGLEIIREERPDRAMKKLYVTLREPVPLDFDRLEHSGVKFRRLDGMEVRFCSIPHDTWPPPHLIDNDY